MRRVQRITIRDVAKKAGVGTTTVSRVINGGKLVAPEVRERIEQVIRQLRYQPSHAARTLAQKRTRAIGLIVPRLTDPFFSTIASIAQEVCRSKDHTLLISTTLDEEEQAVEELHVLDRHRVDGLLIVPTPDHGERTMHSLHRLHKRVVSIDLPIDLPAVSCVQTNNRQATTEATQHLVGHGRKRILFLNSDPRLDTMRERRAGYEEAMAAACLKPMVSEHLDTYEAVEKEMLRLLGTRGRFDGLIAGNSTLGIYAFRVMQRHGILVPADVSFITFDDFMLADILHPPVTCVAQPIEELSRVACELLFRQLESPRVAPQRIFLPSRLIIRASCGCSAP